MGEEALVKDERVGVGGLSLRSQRAAWGYGRHRRPHEAVAAWTRVTATDAKLGAHAEWFPYPQVLAHYHAVGRGHADPDLVATLRSAHDVVTSAADGSAAWLLAGWLPSTFDQEHGGYDSYFGARLLRAVADHYPGSVDAATDNVIVAAVAELVVTEAAAHLSADVSDRGQRARLRAVLQVLARLGELAPHAATDPRDLAGVREILAGAPDDHRLAIAAYETATAVMAGVPAPVRQVMEVTMLPVTRLHDEQMFIRMIQVFESLYHIVADRVATAIAALAGADAEQAAHALGHAAARLECTPALFRVLTTMPPPAFAVIRDNTHGRSAIQSRPYRLVERLCAPGTAVPDVANLPAAEVTGPTLQELFRALPRTSPDPAMARLTEQMSRLDAGWRRMKRTHAAITLKIIGTVTGTGGTDGAPYLRRAAEVPLFPAMKEHSERAACAETR
jgi:tryptophan 2,3-dioxygenase